MKYVVQQINEDGKWPSNDNGDVFLFEKEAEHDLLVMSWIEPYRSWRAILINEDNVIVKIGDPVDWEKRIVAWKFV